MRRILLGTFALIVLIGCSAYVISHDEDAAAKSAIDFSKVAFIQHDIRNSFSLMSEDARKAISFEQYSQAFSQMHPSSYPASVTAEEFEQVPGAKGIYIFLYGENGSEKFYYRIEMAGTAGTGYKVTGMFRGPGPYPPSKLKHKLKTKYSTI